MTAAESAQVGDFSWGRRVVALAGAITVQCGVGGAGGIVYSISHHSLVGRHRPGGFWVLVSALPAG